MKIKITEDFSTNGIFYFKGDEIEPSEIKYETIIKLNEKGYIEPLSVKDLTQIKNGTYNKTKKEEK